VVWKASREVGIGRAQSRDGKWFIVANFYPAGNYVGRNAENVLPPSDGKVALPAKSEKQSTKSGSQLRMTNMTSRPMFCVELYLNI